MPIDPGENAHCLPWVDALLTRCRKPGTVLGIGMPLPMQSFSRMFQLAGASVERVAFFR